MRQQGDCAEEISPSLLLQSHKGHSLLYNMLGEVSFLSGAVLIFYYFCKKLIQKCRLKQQKSITFQIGRSDLQNVSCLAKAKVSTDQDVFLEFLGENAFSGFSSF